MIVVLLTRKVQLSLCKNTAAIGNMPQYTRDAFYPYHCIRHASRKRVWVIPVLYPLDTVAYSGVLVIPQTAKY